MHFIVRLEDDFEVTKRFRTEFALWETWLESEWCLWIDLRVSWSTKKPSSELVIHCNSNPPPLSLLHRHPRCEEKQKVAPIHCSCWISNWIELELLCFTKVYRHAPAPVWTYSIGRCDFEVTKRFWTEFALWENLWSVVASGIYVSRVTWNELSFPTKLQGLLVNVVMMSESESPRIDLCWITIQGLFVSVYTVMMNRLVLWFVGFVINTDASLWLWIDLLA